MLVIFGVVITLLGPDKVAPLARKIGSWWGTFRQWQKKVEEELHDSIPDLRQATDLAKRLKSPIQLLDQLSTNPPPSVTPEDQRSADHAVEHVPTPEVGNNFDPTLN